MEKSYSIKQAERLIKALNILIKYDMTNISAEHDIIFIGNTGERVSEEDEKILFEECKVFFDEEYDCYAIFV